MRYKRVDKHYYYFVFHDFHISVSRKNYAKAFTAFLFKVSESASYITLFVFNYITYDSTFNTGKNIYRSSAAALQPVQTDAIENASLYNA